MPLVRKVVKVKLELDASCGNSDPRRVERHEALLSLIYLIISMT